MKNIVTCCDGTGNEYGKNNTYVVETYALAKKTATQLAYYDPGVGTGGWAYNEESGVLRAMTDQGTGAGLPKNVNDAYRYLMEVYEGPEASRIFLFGFSRGAFTARSLAGMLHKVGLLERNADNHLEYAAKIYNQQRNTRLAAGFKATFSLPAPLHFIGVWDTVESLVLNEGKRWADASQVASNVDMAPTVIEVCGPSGEPSPWRMHGLAATARGACSLQQSSLRESPDLRCRDVGWTKTGVLIIRCKSTGSGNTCWPFA